MTSPLRHLFALVLGLFALGTVAFAAPVKFNIPAQPAPAALKAFIQQSGVQVVFSADDLKDVQANEVKGEFEPPAALRALIKGTGFAAEPRAGGLYVVVRAPDPSGAIEGEVREAQSGRPVPNAKVQLLHTDMVAQTDHRGRFSFESAPTGAQTLLIAAEGMQNTKVTDVLVSADSRLTLSPVYVPSQIPGVIKLDEYTVSARKNDGVIKLDPYSVESRRDKPFVTNMDLTRSINDAQPYFIIDAQAIDQSGASNLEELLKRQLTMNTAAQNNNQQFSRGRASLGNTSSFNLRGLGSNQTLVLVDGRRMAGVVVSFGSGTPTTYGQPDINGIPLAAVDRIEVLPSSASAIYGGSAVGGVINVVLKKEYSGGEIKATYGSTWDGHAPNEKIEASFGESLEGGRTHLLITAAYSKSKPLYVGDRSKLLDRGFTLISKNYPEFFLGAAYVPPIGSGVNFGSFPVGTNLTLKSNGASLGSSIATLPVGYSFTNTEALGLAVIPGKWNLENPDVNEQPNGLRTPLGVFPKTSSVIARLNRQMSESIELYAEASYASNQTNAKINALSPGMALLPSSPANPFNQIVVVTFPVSMENPYSAKSDTRSFTLGARLQLPKNWHGNIDYQWSQSKFENEFIQSQFSSGLFADFRNGIINPFDQTAAGLSRLATQLLSYYSTSTGTASSNLNDLNVRAFGTLATLPAGDWALLVGGEHRKEGSPDQVSTNNLPFRILQGTPEYALNIDTNYGRSQSITGLFLESTIPIISPKNQVPLVNELDIQVAGRRDKYTVDSGTYGFNYFPNGNPQYLTYLGPTIDGKPYRFKTSYSSTNWTIGLRYKPAEDILLRSSFSTAFLPPTYDQLLLNPQVLPNNESINDPKHPELGSYDVSTKSGGNPSLVPQTSRSFGLGAVWEPHSQTLQGLRVALDFNRIVQINAISSLSAQSLVNFESTYPSRITRDPGTGAVTLVDTSLINLYRYTSDYLDMSVQYQKNTSVGQFTLNATGTVNSHLKQQRTLTAPEIDLVGFPSEGGVAKTKATASLIWAWRHWTASWSTDYFGGYKQYGAATDPVNGGNKYYLRAQGGEDIASQFVHNLYLSHSWDRRSADKGEKNGGGMVRLLSGLTVEIGVKNIFNTLPPFDAYYGPFYYSPYGNIRLREYWVSVKKSW